MDRLWARLLSPHDPAALVLFRIAFGLVIAISATRFLAYGWVDEMFVMPKAFLKYWGFAWVPALPAPYMHGVFVALAVLGLLVAAGLFYRVAIVSLFLLFTYVQLIDVTNYLNHYYLVSLLAGLLIFIPAHRSFSLDVWRRPSLRRDHVPAWCTYFLRFQVAVVYFNAGLAKLTGDWLLEAQPLQIWLSARTSVPLIGPFLDQRWVAFAAAWGGFLFDSTVVAFLLARRTRLVAYAVVLLFHLGTAALFPIGMFPVIMIVSALVFFDPSWPRRFLRGAGSVWRVATTAVPFARPRRLAWLALGAAGVYALLQLATPLRSHAYGGDVSWHEQGMRFSWRVMTREKNASVTFVVKNRESGRVWHVSPSRYLNARQEREMSVQPDLILQVARWIAADFEQRGRGPVAVHADARVSLNGRPQATLIDPDVDLARETDGLADKTWILHGPSSRPPQLRSLVAGRL